MRPAEHRHPRHRPRAPRRMLGVARPISSIAVHVVRSIAEGDGPMPTGLQAKLLPQPLSRADSQIAITRSGSARHHQVVDRWATPPTARLVPATRTRTAPIRSAGPSSTSFVSSERSTSPTALQADRQLAGGRSEVEDGQPPLVFGKDGSRLTQDRCESVLVPSNRRHDSEDNRPVSAAPYPFGVSFPTDREADRCRRGARPMLLRQRRGCWTYPNGQGN